MPKPRTIYACNACGAEHPRWMGKCPDCGGWDTLEETRRETPDPHRPAAADTHDALPAHAAPKAVSIADVAESPTSVERLPTGLFELDRVLGVSAPKHAHDPLNEAPNADHPTSDAGLVPGSVVLFGGEPGIGKSTLLLQAAGMWAQQLYRTLYVTSEESAEQVRARAERLGTASEADLFVLADTSLPRVLEQARKVNPRVLIIDSVQMLYKPDLPASPGSVTQLRRCAADLVYFAKATNTAVVLVGHVTKQGNLAGPRLLEHLVDAVIYFEGDRHHAGRIVRAVKNRFGATLELGVFEMTGQGLTERPGGISVEAAHDPRPGAVVCPAVHGSRCVLVEMQALTATGFLGAAKRKASGVDANRLAIIIAVLEQIADLRLADRDVFVQSVGGVRVAEPAADLPLLLAIAGAHLRKSLPPTMIAVGEVGLGGEIRPVSNLEQRLKEAARQGFTHAIVPKPPRRAVMPDGTGLDIMTAATVSRAIEMLQ